ncbi:MAG TPA: sodium:proton antiporter [Terracidiphilus sp.]|jgi:CPA1 family monovalent cation:H+ antiporter
MNTLEIVSVLVATAALFGWISSRVLKLPITIGTMLLTVLATLSVATLGQFAPTVHAWTEHLIHRINFEALILHGLLPLLLFAGAFLLDFDHLAREKFPVAVLSLLGTVLSFLAVAALMMLLAGTGANWTECLIFGALISPTDPIAVLELLRRIGIAKSIEAQLAGESLFNDGIGAVLFLTMIEIARGQAPTPWHVAGTLFLKAGGALVLGVAAAWLVSHLMRLVDAYQVEILLTLMLALAGYVLADHWHVSAPLEAVVAGIALRHFNRRQPHGHIAEDRIDQFWTLLDEVQNSVLFVLLGLEAMVVTVNATTVRAGLAAIFSVTLVRYAAVALCLGLVRLFQKQRRSSATILTLGGLRGGLSIALALSVPPVLGGHSTGSWIFGATYIIVVFSIIIQGGLLQFALVRIRNRAAVQSSASQPQP